MQQDTSNRNRTARTIDENVYSVYMRHAAGELHSQTEQALLTRLVEAIRPEISGGTPRDIIDARNEASAAWEQQSGGVRVPRVSVLNRADGAVGLDAAGST